MCARGEYREASALLDIARRAEEALGLVQGIGIPAAREYLAVVGTTWM